VSRIFGIFNAQLDQLDSDTCHHWMGDTWHHDDVSILRGRLTWQADAALTGPYGDYVASFDWMTADELDCDTWHIRGRMEGCHVAQSRAATWHPYFG
jgi:hypothetical protein